jgi:RHS repeat-associated protein
LIWRLRNDQEESLRKARISGVLAEMLNAEGYTTAYDPRASVLRAADAMARTTTYQFGAAGYVEAIRTGAGRVVRLRHDAVGRLVQVVEPSGRSTELGYADTGTPTALARDGVPLCRLASSPDGSRIAARFWDQTSSTATFNEAGQPLELTDRLGRAQRFAYDDAHRLCAFTDAAGQTTSFATAEDGSTQQTNHADGRCERSGYEAGTLAWLDLNGGRVVDVVMHPLGQPSSLSYSDGQFYEFSRDDGARLTKAIGPNSTSTYTYAGPRLQSENNDGARFGFEYDLTGLLTSIQYPDGSRVRFEYDADKRVVGIVDWNGGVSRLYYDTFEQARSTILPNGLEVTEQLAGCGKPTHTLVKERASGLGLFETAIKFDEQDRVCSIADSAFGLRHYYYDAESQLIGSRAAQANTTETFAYDPSGNRIFARGAPAVIGRGNRLLSQGSIGCTYDEHGNVASLTERTETFVFEYDKRNQMVAAHGPRDDLTFEYDAFGRRTRKKGRLRDVRYVWCGEVLAREVIESASGTETRDYLYLPGTYTPFALRVGNRCFYFHNDHQGVPTRLTDDLGQVVWAAERDAFGDTLVAQGIVEQNLRLPGQYYDQETGICYNRFRYYHPRLGRYLSVDSIGLLGGSNLYLYCGNNPLNRADPLGLWWKAAVSVLAGVAVAALVVATAPVSAPILLVAAGAAALGLGVGLGVNKALNIDEFCIPCAAAAFGQGLLEGAALTALLLLAGPEIAVAGAVVGGYAMLAEHFGWPFPGGDGIAFEDRSEEGKSASLGGLVGNLVGSLLVGIGVSRAGGRGRAGPAPEMVEGEPGGKVKVIDRRAGPTELSDAEAARVIREQNKAVAEEQAARSREIAEARKQRAAEQAEEKAEVDAARADADAKGRRVGELQRDPNATPEQIEAAKQEAQQARDVRRALQRDYEARNLEREAQTRAEGDNLSGRTVETVRNPQTGELTTVASGDEGASQSILRPAESVSPTTEPGKCALPRAAGVVADEAAANGQPRPKLQTIDGGHIIKNGEAVPIEACENCRAVKNDPRNQIQTVGPESGAKPAPDVPLVAPGPFPSTDNDRRDGGGTGGTSGGGGVAGSEGSSGRGDD